MPIPATEAKARDLERQASPVADALAKILFRKDGNLPFELALDDPEFARYPVSAIPLHILGTAAGLRKGFNPDMPKNLTPAAVLSSRENPPAKRSAA